jgi:hypothetical protein
MVSPTQERAILGYLDTTGESRGEKTKPRLTLPEPGSARKGIPVRRDDLVSVVYSTELNSTTSLVPPQRTDRYGILDEKPPTFQLLSG